VQENAMKRRIVRSREILDAGFPLVVMEIQQQANAAHAHDFYEMVYIRRGRGTHMIEDVPYPIRAGDFYFLRPGESHYYLPDGDLRLVNILWQPSLVREILRADDDTSLNFLKPLLQSRSRSESQRLEPQRAKSSMGFRRLHLSGSAAFRVENLLDEMRREIEASQHDVPAIGCHSLLRHLFCALLVLLGRASAAAAPVKAERSTGDDASLHAIGRAIVYLEEHAAETIRVADVAAHVALSPGRFAHLFKTQTGRSVIEYLHELRFDRVCAALRESDLSVQEIAGDAGYNDFSFFHKVFRRYAGCSPTEYRSRFPIET
jgi:AraC-like DNA-binding protein/quercetin dioxygenase-like cupin family protein